MRSPYLNHRARENDVCAQRALGIIALVLTEVCLGQGHGERSLGVDLKEFHNTKY